MPRALSLAGAATVAASAVLLLSGCTEPDSAAATRDHDLVALFPLAERTGATREIDFGRPDSRHHLRFGWAGDVETETSSTTLVLGLHAELQLSLAEARDLTLEFRAWAGLFDQQPVELTLNGHQLETINLGRRPAVHAVAVPAAAVRVGSNRLTLRHREVRRPAEHRDGSRDWRPIASTWDWLRVDGATAATALPSVSANPPMTLTLPCGSEVAYPLHLQPGASLEIRQVQSLAGTAPLVVTLERDGKPAWTARHSVDPAPRPRLVPLPIERTVDVLLTLRADCPLPVGATHGLRLVSPRVRIPTTPATATRPPRPAPPSNLPSNRPNVVVYLIDTLRADHLGCYGYDRPTSPNIDVFARDATLYRNASAQASWTRPAVASLFTGLLPATHGVERRPDAIPDSLVTLAESLRAAGYQTAGVTTNGNVSATFGFDQGFDTYIHLPDNETPEVSEYSDALNRVAFRWLDEQRDPQRPFFLYLHANDPHSPYTPRSPYRERFARSDVDPSLLLEETVRQLISGRRPATAGIRDALIDLYDAEIAHNDASFAALLDKLRDLDAYDDSLIILIADHGEEFHDHGSWGHAGTGLYQEQLHIPLIARYPGGADAGTVVATRARQIDVPATILEVAGIDAPDAYQGLSLRTPAPVVAAPGHDPRTSYAGVDLRTTLDSVTADDWKLIEYASFDRGRAAVELFDLEADPGEATNLADANPVRRAQLSLLLRALRLGDRAAAETVEIDPDLRRELEALGYIQ